MGINTKFLISSKKFCKIIREKTWRRKSRVRLACGDFIYKLSIFCNHWTARLHMEDLDFVSLANWNKYPGPGVHHYYTKIQVPDRKSLKLLSLLCRDLELGIRKNLEKKLRKGSYTWNSSELHLEARSPDLEYIRAAYLRPEPEPQYEFLRAAWRLGPALGPH